MSRPIRISEEAEAEAEAAARWYDGKRRGLGDEFLAFVDAAVDLIASNPGIGSRLSGADAGDTRRVLMRRFPYHVVYIELPDRIQVLAVAHERRRPGYWLDRIRETS